MEPSTVSKGCNWCPWWFITIVVPGKATANSYKSDSCVENKMCVKYQCVFFEQSKTFTKLWICILGWFRHLNFRQIRIVLQKIEITISVGAALHAINSGSTAAPYFSKSAVPTIAAARVLPYFPRSKLCCDSLRHFNFQGPLMGPHLD